MVEFSLRDAVFFGTAISPPSRKLCSASERSRRTIWRQFLATYRRSCSSRKTKFLLIVKFLPCLFQEHIRDALKEIFDASASQFKTIWNEFFYLQPKFFIEFISSGQCKKWVLIDCTMPNVFELHFYILLHYIFHYILCLSLQVSLIFLSSLFSALGLSHLGNRNTENTMNVFFTGFGSCEKKCKGHARR